VSTHASESHTPPSAPSTESGLLKTVLLLIALVLVIMQLKSYYKDHKKEKEEEAKDKKATAASYAATHPVPAVIATLPPIVKIGREPTTHQFGSNGCVMVWLEGNWTSYPQPLNTEIQFFDQHGRKVLEQGAKKRGSSLYPGNYRICGAPGSHATGVQIWN